MNGCFPFYNHKTGYPSKEFFGALDSCLENYIEEKMEAPIKKLGETAGTLKEEMATKLGLCPGTPVGVPMIDSHCGVLVGGVTKPEEIYMTLIEATGFGTRLIVDEFEKAGITIDTIVMSGGIPLKNPMLVQVFADILNREIRVCQTKQAAAVGAAMLGVAAASSEVTGYHGLADISEKIGKKGEINYYPYQKNVEKYDQLYQEYITLCEYFGKGTNDVMKRLNRMRK